jgi:hypothetical protein
LRFRVREWGLSAKLTDTIALEALESVVPPALIQAAAAQAASPTVRRRKLPADVRISRLHCPPRRLPDLLQRGYGSAVDVLAW